MSIYDSIELLGIIQGNGEMHGRVDKIDRARSIVWIDNGTILVLKKAKDVCRIELNQRLTWNREAITRMDGRILE